jgi:peptidoglycan hydrolase CwlO-like protein
MNEFILPSLLDFTRAIQFSKRENLVRDKARKFKKKQEKVIEDKNLYREMMKQIECRKNEMKKLVSIVYIFYFYLIE